MGGISEIRLVGSAATVSAGIRTGAALTALGAALCLAAVPARAQDTVDAASDEEVAAPEQADPAASADGDFSVPPAPEEAQLPEVESVISDNELRRAVPALETSDDPELDRPLETIEAFERRIASEQAGADPAAGTEPPLGDPALADGDANEEIGDAPINDSALTEPLPPIGEFEVTPVEFAEGEGSDNEDVEIRYDVVIEGLDIADKETKADLKAMFKAASALEKGDGEAANAAMVSARLTEDAELMKSVLASQGWYTPVIRTGLRRSRDEDGPPLEARITVTPGTRFTLGEIVVQADPTVPPNLIEDNLALKVGEPIVAERVQGAEAKVALVLPENGYPFAEVKDRDILLDRETGDGIYTLPVEIGPRSRFGGFSTDGSLAFDADHIQVLARFKRGDIYDSRKVDDLRKALVATSLFSTVSVEPKRTGEAGDDGTEYVVLDVMQEAGPPRTIAGSLGYAAGEGFTAEATWTHRNMFPPEGALIAHAIAGTQQQGVGATFRRSNAGKRDRTFEMNAEAFHNDYDAYSAYTGRLAARISRDSTPLWQKRLTYAYGVELIATAETDYNASSGNRDRRTYYIAGLNGQLGFDTTDSLLNPTQGYRLTTLIQPETTVNKGFNPYLRARIDGSAYYSVTDSLVLAGRVRFGTIQGVDLLDIAPSRRLYAGGGGSVRGYSYQGLGEQAPDGRPVGGRSLNEASVEARYRFGDYGVVAFVDAGQAYRETTPQFSNLRYGVGLGGRFYTNFGPIRLDVATPLDRQPGEARINIYVSIGQSF